MLAKNRGATAVAVISLAIAIGPNIVLFSIVNRLILAPATVPGPEAAHLFFLSLRTDKPGAYVSPSYPDLLDFQAEAGDIASFVGYANNGTLLSREGRQARLQALDVTGNYFSVLGLKAAAGRILDEGDAKVAGQPPVVVSVSLAQREFGSAARAVGQTMILDGRGFTVVGVMRRGLGESVLPTDVWIPLSAYPVAATKRGAPIGVLVRLRQGVSQAHAEAVLTTVAKALAKEHPVTDNWASASLQPASDEGRGLDVIGGFILMLAGLVVFVACANIVGILLAQGEARRHEFAMRAAMGATRGRLVRQLVAESLLLSLLGAVVGLLLARWLVPAASDFQPIPMIPIDFGFRLDGTALAYTLLLTLLAALAAGLLPALRLSRTDLAGGLKSNAPVTGRKSRFRGGLVIAQIAFSTFFLMGAGLLLRSYLEIRTIRPGFDPGRKVLVATMAIPNKERNANFEQLADRLRAIPGVRDVSLAYPLPLSGAGAFSSHVSAPGAAPTQISSETAGPHYFSIMGTPLLRGRGFTQNDRADVAVVNETLARRFWGSADAAVGRVLQVDGKARRIVGVAVDGKYIGLDEKPTPFLFLSTPLSRRGEGFLLIETNIEPSAMAGIVRKTIQDDAPGAYISSLVTLRQIMRPALLVQLLSAGLIGAIALLGIFLAGVGLFGLVAYSVGRRTQEIGVRMAVGAGKADIIGLVLRDALSRAGIGLAIGLATALAGMQLLSSTGGVGRHAYHTSLAAIPPMVAAVAVVIVVALLAAYVPVRRALRVDPVTTLRSE